MNSIFNGIWHSQSECLSFELAFEVQFEKVMILTLHKEHWRRSKSVRNIKNVLYFFFPNFPFQWKWHSIDFRCGRCSYLELPFSQRSAILRPLMLIDLNEYVMADIFYLNVEDLVNVWIGDTFHLLFHCCVVAMKVWMLDTTKSFVFRTRSTHCIYALVFLYRRCITYVRI